MQSALTSLICQMKKAKQLLLRPLLVLFKDALGPGGAKEEEELCLRDDSQSRGPPLPCCMAAFGYTASSSLDYACCSVMEMCVLFQFHVCHFFELHELEGAAVHPCFKAESLGSLKTGRERPPALPSEFLTP